VRSLSVKIWTVKRFATLHFSSCSQPRMVNALRLVDKRKDLPCFLVIFCVLLGKAFKCYVQCFLVKCFSGVIIILALPTLFVTNNNSNTDHWCNLREKRKQKQKQKEKTKKREKKLRTGSFDRIEVTTSWIRARCSRCVWGSGMILMHNMTLDVNAWTSINIWLSINEVDQYLLDLMFSQADLDTCT